ncbi:THxN family PEP-CTERM protein [Marinobacter sp.]|uniref:THxN family PEP-CTERM protein n=1 Tax=Marinobacter sp. TaxID=50741 RepID=UPI0035684A09
MKLLAKTLLTTATALTASVAFAFPVELTSVEGTFENAVGGSYVSGEGTSQILWGAKKDHKKSGYVFDGISPLPQTIVDDTPFTLGSFTHINKPITGDAISGVDLKIDLGFSGFGDAGASTGSFVFAHNETPNNAPVVVGQNYECDIWFFGCWSGHWEDVVKNVGDVDDQVWILNQSVSSADFQLGNNIYSLDLIGFEGNAETFFTAEDTNTSINLMARLNVTTVSVPEPGTMALLGLGLLGLGITRRRAK